MHRKSTTIQNKTFKESTEKAYFKEAKTPQTEELFLSEKCHKNISNKKSTEENNDFYEIELIEITPGKKEEILKFILVRHFHLPHIISILESTDMFVNGSLDANFCLKS